MSEQKQQLLDALQALLQQDVTEVKDQVEQIKNQFYREHQQDLEAAHRQAEAEAAERGETLEAWIPEEDEQELAFRQLLAGYKQRRAELLQQQAEELESNLKRKQAILDEMKKLAEAESADGVMDSLQRMRELQAEWRTIGAVAPQHTQLLWKQYQQYQEQFYDLVKINIELRDLDFKRNLEAKQALCEAAERLQEMPNIVEANRMLQQMHAEWAEIGPVARELREELWNRFREASTIINKKHQAHFDELHAQEQKNLEAKQALIEQLKAIDFSGFKSNKLWDEATEAIQALQNEWRKIGFAPKKQNQAIYDEYRRLCEQFFQAKSQYYKQIRDVFSENLQRKRALVERARELAESQDWRATAEAIQALQTEWRTIGPVARKYSDEVWNQFNEACDTFFNARREANREAHEAYLKRREEAQRAQREHQAAEDKRIAKMKPNDMWQAIGEKWKVTKK